MLTYDSGNNLTKAFILGYVYSIGLAASRALDENKNHDPKNGRFVSNGAGISSNAGGETSADKKINEIKIDLNGDSVLPDLNADTLEKMKMPNKPVLLKKGIIDKNLSHHPDVKADEFAKIIGTALYKPEAVHVGSSVNPYFNFIARYGTSNSIVLLEMSAHKENYEVVNFHIIRDRGRRKKESMGSKVA